MAMTSERRSEYPLCKAKKRNGQNCRAFAGQGTDHLGTGRCKYHGGSTPNHRQAAVAAEAQREMVKLGSPIQNIKPHEALMGMLRATAGHVGWLHRQIALLEDLGTHESRVMVALYDSERDRLTRVAKACIDAGVTELEVRVTQDTSETLATAIESAMNAVKITPDQRKQFAQALRMELAMVAESATEPPGNSNLDR